jgi:pimeloyl-ACP methyl ester carboxylesterase
MPTAIVNGLSVAYELHGDQGDAVAITPGGRFSMDTAGIRELALALVQGGKRALIWDRPNTGASDICFDADFESNLHADTLAGLIRALDLGPTHVVGGSGGSRVSLLTALRHPDVVSKLGIWWITGGFFGLVTLAMHYCGESWNAAKRGGMEAVAELPGWQETLEKNPKNRERMLAMDRDEFIARMEAWGPTFLASDGSPVPGLTVGDFAKLTIPTLIFRTGASDLAHLRRTSEWVHELIPASRLVEPPWDDSEWNDRSLETRESGSVVLFRSWPMLAPQLLEFMNEPVLAAW